MLRRGTVKITLVCVQGEEVLVVQGIDVNVMGFQVAVIQSWDFKCGYTIVFFVFVGFLDINFLLFKITLF